MARTRKHSIKKRTKNPKRTKTPKRTRKSYGKKRRNHRKINKKGGANPSAKAKEAALLKQINDGKKYTVNYLKKILGDDENFHSDYKDISLTYEEIADMLADQSDKEKWNELHPTFKNGDVIFEISYEYYKPELDAAFLVIDGKLKVFPKAGSDLSKYKDADGNPVDESDLGDDDFIDLEGHMIHPTTFRIIKVGYPNDFD